MENNNNNNLIVPTGGLQLERKATKKAKTNSTTSKKKPMKVVYISNPMKFKTSASQFRALVQELTGQDAEFPDPTKFVDSSDDQEDVGGNQTVPNAFKASVDDLHAPEVPTEDPKSEGSPAGPCDPSFDDIFVPQMLENISGIMPSNIWYESTHV